MSYRVNADKIKTNYTQTLADFVANLRYEDIPADVLQRAKYITMQTVGAALSTNGLPIAEKAISIGKACGTGEPTATLWVDGSKVSMTSAAFSNSTLADALDWEDCSWTGHPSAGVVPVAWAVAEGMHKSGKEMLTAVVAAYETYQRIAMVVQPPESWDILQGWGLTSWQVFAGVAPAAKLMDLTAEQINQAMGFGVLCCPVQSNLHHATMSDAYHFEHGFRAKDGILGAMTAKAGVKNYTECFDDPCSFDAHMTPEPRREWYTKELGERWLIMEALLKHWPANMWLQTPLDLLDSVVKKHSISPADIQEIVLDPPTLGRMYYSPDGFTSLTQAQFSAPFMLAAYLLNPVPGPDWFDEANLTNPDILELAAKVKGGKSEPHQIAACFKQFQQGSFPLKTLTVTTKDGASYSESLDCPLGHPKNMMSPDQFCDRFRVQASPTLSGERLEKAVMALDSLEDCEDIGTLSWIFSPND